MKAGKGIRNALFGVVSLRHSRRLAGLVVVDTVRRPEGSSLDLNNLPEDYSMQAFEESSTTTAASSETFKRETETLNRARQLVYSNEGLPPTGVHLGLRDLNGLGGAPAEHLAGYPTTSNVGVSDQYCQQFQLPLYPHHHSARGDYYIGHVLAASGISPRPLHGGLETSYTCFGAPLGHNFVPINNRTRPPTTSPDGDAPAGNQIDGVNWSCNYGLDPSFP
ncbi:Zinc finger protein STAMENLESS 1 [Platanthera guangdongensis]|uniref:Zinc finger protein STAMENLESS 1 n=1 Tax=Platanthera guangdongensis TaxID=2320717 RepID=A0ABR2MNX6_9ASPA